MTTIVELKKEIMERARARIAAAEHDYKAGIEDCKLSVYDKWYRYNRIDEGRAYDIGWKLQNQTTQCEKICFINGYQINKY